MNVADENNTNKDTVSLRELVLKLFELQKYLVSQWKTIFTACILGATFGLVYTYLKKPVYVAELTFVLESESSQGPGNYSALAGQFGINLGNAGGGVFEGENLVALMKSRLIIEKVLLKPIYVNDKRSTLAEIYIDMNDFRKDWSEDLRYKSIRFFPGADRSKFSTEQNRLLADFHRAITEQNLSVQESPDNSITTLKLTSVNELFSKLFVELLISEVTKFYIETKTKKSADNVAILQHQSDSVKRSFNQALRGVAISSDANPNPNRSRQSLQVPSQRRQLDVEVNQAILIQLVQNLELAKVALRKETPLVQVIDRPILPLPIEVTGKVRGMLVGAFMFTLMTVLYLILKSLFDKIMRGGN